jgi:hypothetical protein
MLWKDSEADPVMLRGNTEARLIARAAIDPDPVMRAILGMAAVLAARPGSPLDAYAHGMSAAAYWLVNDGGDFDAAVADAKRETSAADGRLRADYVDGVMAGVAILEAERP